MKQTILILLLAASTMAASAQTPAKPASDAKPAATDAKSTATADKPAIADAKPAPIADKPLAHMSPVEGVQKTLFTISLNYQDIKVGAGAAAEPKKLLKYYFTLWLAADGSQIDSTDDHRAPVLDKDKKPVLDDNGKPKQGDPQPAALMMGMGRPLLGWDMGFEGMKAGGKRRIFIPWQLGLGAREIPAHDATHPGIPAKSDLVLDVELIDVTDAPPPPSRPSMAPRTNPMPGATPAAPAAPAAPAPPAAPAAPTAPAPPTAAQPQPK
ncbi:MAG: FKBP-type peptidyl-prolyl cis-trans isomerase [Terracidiphilus sp.]|jgi:peptidylprolyl isomerase